MSGSTRRDGQDLEAQPRPGCVQHGQQGSTEREEDPDQACHTQEEQRQDHRHVKRRGPSIWKMLYVEEIEYVGHSYFTRAFGSAGRGGGEGKGVENQGIRAVKVEGRGEE